jgi:hypothetical protein
MKHKSITILILFFLLLSLGVPSILAQVTSSGIAQTVPVEDSDAADGDIICTYLDAIKRCNRSYDPSTFGVITDNPAAEFTDTEVENGRLVVRDGLTSVRVSTANGPIGIGDFITTSETAGVGQKATENGYVIGVAMDEYSVAQSDQIGTIQVVLNIHPATTQAGARGNLLQFIRKGVTVPIFEPLESLRYLLAVIIVIISFTLGLIYFGRASRTGIEAIGRNPLAKRVIQLTVLLNIVLTIVIVLVGLAIAYLILIL